MDHTFALSASSASRVGRKFLSDLSDDRVVVDTAHRLFAVADGSGPTYGGYHAPIGMDVGLASIRATLASEDHAYECNESCVVAAFAAAHDEMQSLDAAYKVALEDETRKTPDNRLDASLRASQAIARTVGRSIDSFAHFYASITALHFTTKGKVVAAQVGNCRAYGWRRGSLELLLPDHALPDLEHEGVVTRMLGSRSNLPPDVRNELVEVGDRYVVCSDGVWRTIGEPGLEALCSEPDAATLASSVIALVDHKGATRDASVVVVVVT